MPGKMFLPPAGMPFLNPQTGLINTEWYMALRNILIFQGTGVLVSTSGQGNAIVRSIVGGAGIDVSNGDGQAGNPTILALGPDGFGFFVGGFASGILLFAMILGVAYVIL